MFEKVNPSHPDKIADRIAGAIVDLAYSLETDPKIAVEVLLGHGICEIIMESSVDIPREEVVSIVRRIVIPDMDNLDLWNGQMPMIHQTLVPQDKHLSDNQQDKIRCGDNGIFKGMPVTDEQRTLTNAAQFLYSLYPSDGKYIMSDNRMIICQSKAKTDALKNFFPSAEINPLGEWTGGIDVDSGATNRKLGSDMGDSVTGGGLHGKDLSKADVSVNIYAHILAQRFGVPIQMCCAIGDENVNGIPYSQIVEEARKYIKDIGGFEKFAEWGLIR